MSTSELETAAANNGEHFQTLPEVPDDGVLIKTLYAGVCHANHSPLQDELDLANVVG